LTAIALAAGDRSGTAENEKDGGGEVHGRLLSAL
jgi:hypothetical protein